MHHVVVKGFVVSLTFLLVAVMVIFALIVT